MCPSSSTEDYLSRAFPDRRREDQVDHAGLIFQGAERNSPGHRGPLDVLGQSADPHPGLVGQVTGLARGLRPVSCPDFVFVSEVRPRLPACNAQLKETFHSSCPRAKVGEFQQ